MEWFVFLTMKTPKKATFKVSVDDGFVEYQYELDIPDSYSISQVATSICALFGGTLSSGKMRMPNVALFDFLFPIIDKMENENEPK
jgi:hypothetical protein